MKQRDVDEWQVLLLYWVIKEGFSNEVAFKARSQWLKEAGQTKVREKTYKTEGTVSTSALKQDWARHILELKVGPVQLARRGQREEW